MPQPDLKTKTIGEYTYEVWMLDPFDASDLLVDLLQTAAPALGALGSAVVSQKDGVAKVLEGVTSDDPSDNLSGEAIERAVLGVIGRLDKTMLRAIATKMMTVSRVQMPDGKKPELKNIFSEHFKGRTSEMLQWLTFAVRSQYGGFFESANQVIARVTELAGQGQ